ncbi:glycogen phosphorylase [Anaeramoeba flamelloides]|uniref:Alpha-1,4 glucan phosphorylase n=1 Tax=Anaeramoeba flamelloides TaxID=1746091 RepID=A0AAV7YMK6_9EUKA|nr:glycogen phosphorylase [Anaeramoeba flamelloides]
MTFQLSYLQNCFSAKYPPTNFSTNFIRRNFISIKKSIDSTKSKKYDENNFSNLSVKQLNPKKALNKFVISNLDTDKSFFSTFSSNRINHDVTTNINEKQKQINKLVQELEDQQKYPIDEKPFLIKDLITPYLHSDYQNLQKQIAYHLEYTLPRNSKKLETFGTYLATSYTIRDRLLQLSHDTQKLYNEKKVKQACYISIEYLMGRFLRNAVLNLNLEEKYEQALAGLGYAMEDIYDEEQDPALGNGGLGRLAACFLDTLATHNYPAWGYGLKYNYGLFKQSIGKEGEQVEKTDVWLDFPYPFMIEDHFIRYPIGFYGSIETYVDEETKGTRFKWKPGEYVIAQANDILIPGYGTDNTNTLRLWSCRPIEKLDFDKFSLGDFKGASVQRINAENITNILYPNDNEIAGKELRFKQQYFLVAATLHDIIRRLKEQKRTIYELPDFVAIQLNDTHPTLAIPELLRILLDEEKLTWDEAWGITERTFSYTNHTILPEALEKWPVKLMSHLLPRHMQLIEAINWKFLEKIRKIENDKGQLTKRMSLIENSRDTLVRMAWLGVVGSHKVNGVSDIHTNILKNDVFQDFHNYYPNKFVNVTNGVTPRRWLHACNPKLSELITDTLKSNDWIYDLSHLSKLREYADNEEYQLKWAAIKQYNKKKLQRYIKKELNIEIGCEDVIYDIQIKRIHEYKRQLMNVLASIHFYLKLKKMSKEEKKKVQRRVSFIAGKAAPGYIVAKKIIKLINCVSKVINNDPEIGDLFKVIFIPNYSVTLAELLIPASDVSEHISTPGCEASGTSNMKFVLNGGLILGTYDGANLEIMENSGEENVFAFGITAKEVPQIKQNNIEKGAWHLMPKELQDILGIIEEGTFGDPEDFHGLLEELKGVDRYITGNDFIPYIKALDDVIETYQNHQKWWRMSILGCAGSGWLSSDRTIKEYAEKIWDIQPCPLPKFESENQLGLNNSFCTIENYNQSKKNDIKKLLENQNVNDKFRRVYKIMYQLEEQFNKDN